MEVEEERLVENLSKEEELVLKEKHANNLVVKIRKLCCEVTPIFENDDEEGAFEMETERDTMAQLIRELDKMEIE
ncbi:MAG: hypothetical protein JST59_00280 [Actinobacteria bacterium]|nr:hypothetical protein [Actinomycetota bacterium]